MSVDVLREVARRVEAGESVALATIVATRGSTPQKVGARMLVGEGGRLAGTLGGGGVEAEAVEEARRVLGSARPLLREYALADGTDDWGLASGGTMVVFVEPIGRGALGWLRALVAPRHATDGVAVVAVVEGDHAAARLLVSDDGRGERAWAGDAPAFGEASVEAGRRGPEREGAEPGELGGTKGYVEAVLPPPTPGGLGAGPGGKALAGLGR